MMKTLLLLLLLLPFCGLAAYKPQNGDIIFQSSRSSQSQAIQKATHSPYSHMGIIFIRNGKPYVLEAIDKVSWTPLQRWINRGVDRHYVVKRVAGRRLNKRDTSKMEKVATTFINKPYDLLFNWSDEKMYCSELVWKIYDRALNIQIGQLQPASSFDLSSPMVQMLIKKRYGDAMPLHEKVIAPSAMLASPLLITVKSARGW